MNIFFFLLAYKFFFMLFLLISTLMTMSANTWFMAWLGLEINIMAFIPLLANYSTLMSEATLKYFLIQTISSTILLFSSSMLMMFSLQMLNSSMINLNSLIECSLMMKLGAAPFHLWLIHLINGLSWINSILLLTWQKIAPLMLLFIMNNTYLIWIIIIISTIISSLGGLNQLILRKIIGFSSINHMSWILCALMMSKSILMMYFLFYIMISMMIMIFMNYLKMSHMNQMFMLMKNKMNLKILIALLFFSLGGLPPLLGFFPKWLILNVLLMSNFFFIPFILIFTSLTILVYYIRLSYSMFLFNSFNLKWINYSMKLNMPMKTIIFMFSMITFFPLMIYFPTSL